LDRVYGAQLQERLNQQNLTIYGASQIVAAETDEVRETVEQRIRRYLKSDPDSLRLYAEIVEALGGKLKIEW
jgi:hypothetical protein